MLWNGEVYAGFPPHLCFDYAHDNDTEVVLRMLSTATAAVGGAQAVSGTRPTHLEIGFRVAAAVHPLRGPYSFIFWHSQTQTLCYGRDPSGRRSLLRRVLEARGEKVLLVSSVSFATPTDAPATSGGDRGDHVLDAWTELEPLGVWAVSFDSTEPVSALATQGSLCRWPTLTVSPPALPVELELVARRRNIAHKPLLLWTERVHAACELLHSLAGAVRRRVRCVAHPGDGDKTQQSPSAAAGVDGIHRPSSIGVLFSGGIDCMVIARLLGASTLSPLAVCLCVCGNQPSWCSCFDCYIVFTPACIAASNNHGPSIHTCRPVRPARRSHRPGERVLRGTGVRLARSAQRHPWCRSASAAAPGPSVATGVGERNQRKYCGK